MCDPAGGSKRKEREALVLNVPQFQLHEDRCSLPRSPGPLGVVLKKKREEESCRERTSLLGIYRLTELKGPNVLRAQLDPVAQMMLPVTPWYLVPPSCLL